MVFSFEDQWQELFGCKILYFTPSSEQELTHFDSTDLQTGFYSMDFSADMRLVWKTNYLRFTQSISPLRDMSVFEIIFKLDLLCN